MRRLLLVIALAMLPYNVCRCQTVQDMLGATTSITYAPVADPQQITLNTISAIPLTLTGYDANGYPLSFVIVDPPSRGVLGSLNASTGNVTYTPPAELSGSDSFTFSVTSGAVTSPPATVTMVLAHPGNFDLNNGGVITINPGATTGNTAAITVTPSNGFSGTVNLICTVTSSPANSTSPVACSIPSSVSISGTSAATATLTATTTSLTTVGDYAITVTGTDAATGKITSSTVVAVIVNLVPTVTVSPTQTSITTAQMLTVTVAVGGGPSNPTPTGTVTLSGGGYTSVAATLSGGSATINIPAGSLATGADTLTGSYSGDTNFSATTGTAVVTVTTVVSATFTVSGTAVAITPGATTGNTSTITVTPTGGFIGSVALTASVTSSPADALDAPTLSFGLTTPVSIIGTAGGTATLTISSTAATNAALVYPKRRRTFGYAGAGATLVCILLFGMPARRRSWRAMLGLLLLLIGISGGVLACGGGGNGSGGGGGGPSNLGTTAGTYTVTITGKSGSTTASGAVTLTVQ